MEKKKTENKKEDKKPEKNDKKLLVVIRISGMVKVNYNIENTLDRLRLRRKYACVLVYPNKKDVVGMLEKVKFYVAYGEIKEETLIKLLKARGQKPEKESFNAVKVAEDLMKGRTLKELGLKSFFRLHPPRKGIRSKLQYPKGVLGNNKQDINKLIERML